MTVQLLVRRGRIDELLTMDDALLRASPSLRRGNGLPADFTAAQYRAWLKAQPAGTDVHASPHRLRTRDMDLVLFMSTVTARDAECGPVLPVLCVIARRRSTTLTAARG